MSVEIIANPGSADDDGNDSTRDWEAWQAEIHAGRVYGVEDVGSGYLFPKRAGRMALTSGFAEEFQTDRVMPRQIPIPHRILPPIVIGPEQYLG